MKRTARLLSLAAIAASLGAIFWLFGPAHAPAAETFAINDHRLVHFRSAPDMASDVDQEDQLRDWLLYAVLNESGLDSESLRKVLFDVPPSRAAYLKPVASFEFGETRYRVIDAHTVLGLVPEGGKHRNDQLAQIADAARISLGSRPDVVRVFEYSIDPVELSANVIRKPDVSGKELFSSSYGYIDQEVSSESQLGAVMAQIDDVSSVALARNGLRITGRKVDGSNAHKMRVEDLAAVWQSQNTLALDKQRIETFDERWKEQATYRAILEPMLEAERKSILERYPESVAPSEPPASDLIPGLPKLDDNSDAVARITPLIKRRPFSKDGNSMDLAAALKRYQAQRAQAAGLAEPSPAPEAAGNSENRDAALAQLKAKWTEAYQTAILEKQRDQEFAELKKSLASKGGAGIPTGSGFSLDPAFDYDKLGQVFDRLRPLLERTASADEINEARRQIDNRQEGPFLDLLYKVENAKSPFSKLVAELSTQLLQIAKFQHARYDGSLSGTEAGMVLFYTDLVAKLWALDYLERAPEQQVRGFVPLLKVAVSPIYEKEVEELSGTRLWFGPRDSGYSKTENELLFSRIATRVYAASSNTLQPGKEAEPNAASSEFLGWWNDHYSQIAQFEPEYQRLNQIMKWSMIVGWLSASNHLDNLEFLASVNVKHDNWFPTWARANRDLRFHDWERVAFHNRGYEGVDTESMEILRSRPWTVSAGTHTLSGGVSLGSPEQIAIKTELKLDVEAVARRANMEEIPSAIKGSAFKSTDNTVFEFRPFRAGEPVSYQAKPATKLRGEDIELKKAPFDFGFVKRHDALTVSTAADGHPIGDLSITQRTAAHEIDVFFAPRDTEYARAYGKTISAAGARGESPLAALASRPDVNRVIESKGVFYVETRGSSSSWLRISSEGDPVANISQNADLRFAGIGGGGREGSRWNVSFIDRQKADAELSKNAGYLVPETGSSARPGVAFSVMDRGPPPPGAHVTDLGNEPANSPGVLSAIDRRGSNAGGGNNGGRGSDGGVPFGSDDEGERLARKATAKPDQVVVFLETRRRYSLRASDALIHEGRFEEAQVELDQLARLFPNDPDVLMRKAIAHAAGGSPTAGAEAAALRIQRSDVPAFLDAADAALPHSGTSFDRLDALVRGTLMKIDGEEVHYFKRPDARYGVEVKLSNVRQRVVPDSGAGANGGLRYSLENLDTNTPVIHAPVPPASESILGKLRDPVIARLQPDAIFDPQSNQRFLRRDDLAPGGHPVSGIGGGGPPGGSFRSLYDLPPNSCDQATEEERRNRPECRNEVYVAESNPGKGRPTQ